MKKRILKGAGYLAAPKAMFTANHPRKAAMAAAAGWAMNRISPRRRRNSMGMTAAKGLGAAAVALPVGMWLGRKVLHRQPQPNA